MHTLAVALDHPIMHDILFTVACNSSTQRLGVGQCGGGERRRRRAAGAGWKGEESVKDRVVLEEAKVVPFLEGSYTLDQALADLDKKARRRPAPPRPTHLPRMPAHHPGASRVSFSCKGFTAAGCTAACVQRFAALLGAPSRAQALPGMQKRSEAEKKTFAKFFSECQKAVDSKQLRPMTRTQYQRTAFQALPPSLPFPTPSLSPPIVCGAGGVQRAISLPQNPKYCTSNWLESRVCSLHWFRM